VCQRFSARANRPNNIPARWLVDYEIIKLTDELVFIRWLRTPGRDSRVEDQYLSELRRVLDESPVPLYFLSDLRQGRIADIRAIQKLGQLTKHKHWAGSTAFSTDPITALLVRSFRSFATKVNSRNEMQTTPEAALSFLETLKPGITEGVDWERMIGKPKVDQPQQ
jgi:hypothetical protein